MAVSVQRTVFTEHGTYEYPAPESRDTALGHPEDRSGPEWRRSDAPSRAALVCGLVSLRSSLSPAQRAALLFRNGTFVADRVLEELRDLRATNPHNIMSVWTAISF